MARHHEIEETDTSSEEGSVSCEKTSTKDLQTTIKKYRNKIYQLEDASQKKEEHIHSLRRLKDKLEGELRRLENSNKNLKRQLAEERKEYAVQKETFCYEMLECKRSVARLQSAIRNKTPYMGTNALEMSKKSDIVWSNGSGAKTSLHFELFSEIASLRTENEKLRRLVEQKDEQNHEFCVRFLRMKRTKDILWKRFQEIDEELIHILKNFMEKFDEVRQEYNFIVAQNFCPTNSKYIGMAQNLSNLAYENAYLKLELQSLKKDINAEMYGPRRSTGKKTTINDNKSTRDVGSGTEDLQLALSTKTLVGSSESSRSQCSTTNSTWVEDLLSCRRLQTSPSLPNVHLLTNSD